MVTNLGDLAMTDLLRLKRLPGASYWGKFGAGIVSNVPSTVFSGTVAGQLVQYPRSPSTMWMASTDPDDTVAGLGCRFVHVYGLNADLEMINEVVPLNGQTPVGTSNEYFRIYRLHGEDDEDHPIQGQVYLSASGTGWSGGEPPNIYGHINDGYNQSQMGFYTVPKGYKLWLQHWWLSAMKDFEVEMWMVVRSNLKTDGTPNELFRMRSNWGLYRNTIEIDISDTPFVLNSGEEFEIRGKTSSAGTEKVFTTLTGYLVPEKYFGNA